MNAGNHTILASKTITPYTDYNGAFVLNDKYIVIPFLNPSSNIELAIANPTLLDNS